MVDEPSLIAEACGIDDPVAVEIEEEGEVFTVVYDAPAFGFLRGDELPI